MIDDSADLEAAVEFIQTTLYNCQQSKESAWLFNSKLQDSRAEVPISRQVSGRLHHFVVDRTFIDENGVRWIIDYKTTKPELGVTVEEFVQQQVELHAPQLTTYRRLFEQMESRPVRTAVLFTSLPKLVEIDCQRLTDQHHQ